MNLGMRVNSLCYQDVVGRRAGPDPIGFGEPVADTYKLGSGAFRVHLQAIQDEVLARRNARRPGNVLDLLRRPVPRGCLLTFDDTRSSTVATVAPMLEEFGWRGHFFIATDYIDAPGFLNRAGIRELHRRGHVIGTHSCSSSSRMSSFAPERLVMEWGISKEILSGVLGEDVTTASVPSGYHSRRIAEAAALVGIKALFTLEPTAQVEAQGGCLVFGRYQVRRATPAARAAKLAVGSAYPCAVEWLSWNAKKMATWR